MRELPRVTRSLRAFTDLGRIKKFSHQLPNDILLKRQEQAEILKRSGIDKYKCLKNT